MIDRTNILLLALLLPLLLLTGCCYDHKELEYGGAADVSIYFDWSNTTDADVAAMKIVVFDEKARPIDIPFNNRYGGSFVLPAGYYQYIAHNDGLVGMFPRGTTYDDFEIFAQHTTLSNFAPMFASTRIPMARGTESQIVIMEPDGLWTAANRGQALGSDGVNQMVMTMQYAIRTYHFTITNVENLQYVSSLAASVSGMSEAWIPSQGRGSDLPCVIPFNLQSDGYSTITGSVRTFGHIDMSAYQGGGSGDGAGGEDSGSGSSNPDDGDDGDVPQSIQLVIYAEMTDGHKYYYTFDITDEIMSAESDSGGTQPGEVTVTDIDVHIDDIPLPKPLQNGSGIHPDVDQWKQIDISVKM